MCSTSGCLQNLNREDKFFFKNVRNQLHALVQICVIVRVTNTAIVLKIFFLIDFVRRDKICSFLCDGDFVRLIFFIFILDFEVGVSSWCNG